MRTGTVDTAIKQDSSRLSALGFRLSALGSRLSALGSRLSALPSRLSALGSRLSESRKPKAQSRALFCPESAYHTDGGRGFQAVSSDGSSRNHDSMVGSAAIAAASPALTISGPDSKLSHSMRVRSGARTRSLAWGQPSSLLPCMIW